MDQWEYATVVCYSHTSFEDAFVKYYNGSPVVKQDSLVTLVEFLNELGLQGWESTGVLPNIAVNSWMILLKRKK